MLFDRNLIKKGETPFIFPGLVGAIESILTVPENFNPIWLAVIGHPHSLQGGTMNNKVVTTLARVFAELGIASIRFNFRSVGGSAGRYDAGLGESEDMALIAKTWRMVFDEVKVIYAGFSFGSYVAYRAASQSNGALLITVAPAVTHYDYNEFKIQNMPWILAQAEHDEVVPIDAISEYVAKLSVKPQICSFPHAGHFFHGQLTLLKSSLLETIPKLIDV